MLTETDTTLKLK